jgi:hypothetical protein
MSHHYIGLSMPIGNQRKRTRTTVPARAGEPRKVRFRTRVQDTQAVDPAHGGGLFRNGSISGQGAAVLRGRLRNRVPPANVRIRPKTGLRNTAPGRREASTSSHQLLATRKPRDFKALILVRVSWIVQRTATIAPGSSEMALRCNGSRQTDRPKSRPRYLGHRPFGCQSWVIVTHGLDESCNTRMTDRLISLPTLESAIGGPSSTTAPSPACLTVMPAGVSRH